MNDEASEFSFNGKGRDDMKIIPNKDDDSSIIQIREDSVSFSYSTQQQSFKVKFNN
jgi:hypothetical protein